MNKTLSVFISVVFITVIAGLAVAAEKIKVKQRSGEVVAIDISAKALTLKPVKYKDNIVVTINENTLVKMNKEKKALIDIKVGDNVTVWVFEKDNVAKSIEIKAAKAVKKDAAPVKPAAKPATSKPGY